MQDASRHILMSSVPPCTTEKDEPIVSVNTTRFVCDQQTEEVWWPSPLSECIPSSVTVRVTTTLHSRMCIVYVCNMQQSFYWSASEWCRSWFTSRDLIVLFLKYTASIYMKISLSTTSESTSVWKHCTMLVTFVFLAFSTAANSFPNSPNSGIIGCDGVKYTINKDNRPNK